MASPTSVVNGPRAIWGISDCGQLMGQPSEAGLASVEPEGVYEHLAIGVLEEGYTLAYVTPDGTDHVKYDVYESTSGIVCVGSHICRDDRDEFVKMTESRTDDGLLEIQQTFIISKNETRVCIRMEITNCRERESVDLTDVLIKRYADIDVDTGGSAGWAGFAARWDKNRYSVFSYNLDDDAREAGAEGRRGHVVNMVAMPGDLPLDTTFVGVLGSKQYQFRDNPDPVAPLPSNRVDAAGVLQWRASRLLAGETLRVNLYYDTFRSFAR
jgi:hypothetical protein